MKHIGLLLKSSTFSKAASAVILIACSIILVQTHHIDRAEACRDCPFPTPISKLHWLMPGGYSEIMVDEINLGSGQIQSVVRLVDAMTGELLAIGHLDHAKGRKRITVMLYDMAGGAIEAQLYYTNVGRDKVRIRIKCQSCNLKAVYLN
jgi:hypothetical protein